VFEGGVLRPGRSALSGGLVLPGFLRFGFVVGAKLLCWWGLGFGEGGEFGLLLLL